MRLDIVNNDELKKFLKNVWKNNIECAKFTRPNNPSTKATHIDTTFNNYKHEKPFIVSYGAKFKNKNGFICIIDYKNSRVFICVNVIDEKFEKI